MLVKHLVDSQEFVAGDHTRLRELLHPSKDAVDLRYSLAHAVVDPGTASLRHRLTTSEVYYLLSGSGIMHIDSEQGAVQAGDLVYIPPGSTQFIENPATEPVVFLCLVDPPWRAEDEEILT